MRTILSVLSALAAIVILVTMASQASATVMDYHDFVQSYGDTLVQYDFDGTTDSERREDKKGANDLVQKVTTTYDLDGFDTSSQAVDGGFFTGSALNLPTTVSFDAIARLDAVGAGGWCFLVGSYYPGATSTIRSYFGVEQTGNAFMAGAGSTSNIAIVNPYNDGNWYYYAVTMSYNSDNDKTTINTYVANLTDGATSLTHVSNNAIANGEFRNSLPYGIGVVNNNGTAQQEFSGLMDEITFYNGVKNQDFFQANLDRIVTVPEPSSLLLLLVAVGALGLTVRRYR